MSDVIDEMDEEIPDTQTQATPQEVEPEAEVEIEMPKYVALMGVTGKSALAQRIAEEYGMFVVDNYAQEYSESMDVAIGFFASYIPNLMVAFEREKAEQTARMSGAPVVTCGTLIETLAYAGLQAEYHSRQIETPQQQALLHRELLGAQLISAMIVDTLRYSHFFFLRLPVEIEVPGQDPKWNGAYRALDNAISQVVEQMRVPVTELKGSTEQQMEVVRQALGAVPVS